MSWVQMLTILPCLLPDATLLHLDACAVDEAAHQITRAVRSTQATAPCPLCTTQERRITRTDGFFPLCFLQHAVHHLCYDGVAHQHRG
jgi:hypothetical protein